eukprot:scaffold438907_cov14-Prasinocladus_malaysianus.AAC.1
MKGSPACRQKSSTIMVRAYGKKAAYHIHRPSTISTHVASKQSLEGPSPATLPIYGTRLGT